MLNLDLETRSAVDLKREGLYRYAPHKTTDVLCAAYKIDGGPVQIWRGARTGKKPDRLPPKIVRAVEKGCEIHAWNATFERLLSAHVLSSRYGWPLAKLEQYVCTAARSRAMGHPGALDLAARFIGHPLRKDLDGSRIMRRMCKPRKVDPLAWWEEPEDFEKLYAYCAQDVMVEHSLGEILRPLDARERAAWLLNERLSDYGWRIDVPLARRAVAEAEKLKVDMNALVEKLTKGRVKTLTQNAEVLAWAREKGAEIDSLEAKRLKPYLEYNGADLRPDVRELLELRLNGARAAVGKFEAMLARKSEDGFLRGVYIHHGAGQTGRYTSVGIQAHNLLRDSKPELAEPFLKRGLAALKGEGAPMKLLAALVRPAFIPRPKKLICYGDWNQIEARGLPWLAVGCGLGGARHYLRAWENDQPVYEQQAAEIFHVPLNKVTKDQRFVGKVCILAFGYQGSALAYVKLALAYGVETTEAEAERYCSAWRGANPWALEFWKLLEQSVIKATRRKGVVVDLGLLSFVHDGGHLWMKLPSGRLVCYPFARLRENSWGGDSVSYCKSNRRPAQGEHTWPEVQLYGGLLAENATQGACRDVLVDTQLVLEKEKRLKQVGHTHDEIVTEGAAGGEKLLKKYMERRPAWASTLPLRADTWAVNRYE